MSTFRKWWRNADTHIPGLTPWQEARVKDLCRRAHRNGVEHMTASDVALIEEILRDEEPASIADNEVPSPPDCYYQRSQ
jgi:hypothetical protein